MPSGRAKMIVAMLRRGYTPAQVSDALAIPLAEVEAARDASEEQELRQRETAELPVAAMLVHLEAGQRGGGNGERGR